MAYLAFYRAFRPTTFDEVVRQEHIVKILKNQINENKVGHAYLFCGPRGTGKTTLAKIFARAINCENPVNGSPCGVCPTCRALANGANLDISEIDAASNNGVDEMRDLREKVQYPPVAGKYKVYIIDEVHMLSASAFNAVLKTLEEPPAHAVFILATTEPQKIPATILSRCMRFDFKLIPREDLENLIKSVLDRTGKTYENEAVSAIARAGAGSARDCLSIADMCASYSTGKLTYADVNAVLGSADFNEVAAIVKAILSEDEAASMEGVERVLSTGKSVGVLIKDLLNFLNWCAIVKTCKNAQEIINLPEDRFALITDCAAVCDGHKLLRVTEVLAKAETDMRFALNGRITLETAVLRCATPSADYDIDALIGRIAALERKIESGDFVQKTAANITPRAESVTSAESKKTDFYRAEKAENAESVHQAPKVTVTPVESAEADLKSPFESNASAVQGELWEHAESTKPASAGSLTDASKGTLFARFLRALRTTRKNAVLFTLCMDLENLFEGDRLVLVTDNESIFRGLNKEDNRKFIAETLAELGVLDFDIRLKGKDAKADDFDRALEQLKENFKGTDIIIK